MVPSQQGSKQEVLLDWTWFEPGYNPRKALAWLPVGESRKNEKHELGIKVHLTPTFVFLLKNLHALVIISSKFFFLIWSNPLFFMQRVEFWMDHDHINRDLGRVELWCHFEKTVKPSQPIPWICCGSSLGFLARKFILFSVYSSWNSSEIYNVFQIIGVGDERRFRRLGNKFYHCLNDRQPVKVLKSLNDRHRWIQTWRQRAFIPHLTSIAKNLERFKWRRYCLCWWATGWCRMVRKLPRRNEGQQRARTKPKNLIILLSWSLKGCSSSSSPAWTVG